MSGVGRSSARGPRAQTGHAQAEHHDAEYAARGELPPQDPTPEREPLPVPSAWAGVDPAAIPRRRWLSGRYLCRGILSVTVSPGGVGKSSLALVEALAMATGHKLHDQALPAGAVRAWYINLEDPPEELDRRLAGACLHFGIRYPELGGRLFINSGVDTPLKLAGLTARGQAQIDEAAFAHIEEHIDANGIDAIIVDPFVSSHDLPESDNGMIDRLAKRWARLAMRCGVGVGLVHHTKKLPSGVEHDADSARGASALINAARVVRVLNPMSKDEAGQANIREELRRLFFRASRDKQNLAPPDADKNWYRMVGVNLGNGTPPAQADADEVGVATRWEWPSASIAEEMGRAIQERGTAIRDQILDGMAACLGSAWMAPREVVARLQSANITHGRQRVIDVLQTLAGDSDGASAIVHNGVSIEVETQRTLKRMNLRFRLARDEHEGARND